MFPAIRQYIEPSNLLMERAVAQWTDINNNEDCFLGAHPDDSFNMNVGLEPFTNNLLLWFQLVVNVKKHRAARPRPRSVFMIVQADMFDYEKEQCVSLDPVSNLSHPTPSAVARAALDSAKDFFRLSLRLKTKPQVIMPKADPPLLPATEKSRSLLMLLHSLSHAKDMAIYLPLGTAHAETLEGICASVIAQKLTNHSIDFESVYRDGAERDAWSNFDIFRPSTTQLEFDPSTSKATPSDPSAPPLEPAATPCTGKSLTSPPPTYEAEARETNVVAEQRETTTPPTIAQTAANDRVSNAESAINSNTGGVLLPSSGAGTTAAPTTIPTTEAQPSTTRRFQADPDDDGETTEDEDDLDAPSSAAATTADPPNPLKRKANTPSPPNPSPDPPTTTCRRQRRHRSRVHFASPPPPSSSAPTPAPSLPHGTNRTRSSSRNSTPDSLRAALAQFLLFLANVDVELEARYEEELWDMGDCARTGDGVGFYEVQARCKAEVLVRYRRRRADEVGE